MQSYMKRSAIHNLRISSVETSFSSGLLGEGIVIPETLMQLAEIEPFEQVIITKIYGDNWVNRLKSFALPGKDEGRVEVRGSLGAFLQKGELVCLITQTFLSEDGIKEFVADGWPLFDVGFNPETNVDNLEQPRLDIEFHSHKLRAVEDFAEFHAMRRQINRMYLKSLILNLQINQTHPDCLQGSAELPAEIMDSVGLRKYQSVAVYNATKGGMADTYAVPMPPEVVMTTGAMAKFAGIGERVNVATFALDVRKNPVRVGFTDGCKLKEIQDV